MHNLQADVRPDYTFPIYSVFHFGIVKTFINFKLEKSKEFMARTGIEPVTPRLQAQRSPVEIPFQP